MYSTEPDIGDPTPLLSYERRGSGEALVLLHGLGSSRQAWTPVIPLLSDDFDVIAIDLPGFGDSAVLPRHTEPRPAAIAAAVAETLRRLGVDSPHVAGNSLGGWVALELAALVPVDSITLFSPAGLWRGRTPLYDRASLTMLRAAARFGAPVLRPLARYQAARWIMFRQIVGRPTSMSAARARQAIRDMGRAPGFTATLRASLPRAYVSRAPIEAPVSVSFGTRDLLLVPGRSRHLDQLPAQTCVVPLPGTGHVPMTDDPAAVASLITETTERAPVDQPVNFGAMITAGGGAGGAGGGCTSNAPMSTAGPMTRGNPAPR
jgi:pimeloyl-ACP methyl ester carboxylesterase